MASQANQPYFSPLRYPGGKAALYGFLSKTITANKLTQAIYAEAFAGGAGAALALLMNGHVARILLNDKDPFVYKFWWAVLNQKSKLIKLIQDTPVTMDEYKKRKQIFRDPAKRVNLSDVEIGFTAFFLNRCNRSGILHAGPIGGLDQTGEWKIDARYNKEELIRRINQIHQHRRNIKIYNLDAVDFVKKISKSKRIDNERLIVYLDPPYVAEGYQLYRHFFKTEDHQRLAKFMKSQKKFRWIISYDDHPLVVQLYRESSQNCLWFNYFANTQKVGKELVISSENCVLPAAYTQYSRERKLNQLSFAFEEALQQKAM